jgi:hypothetical protein
MRVFLFQADVSLSCNPRRGKSVGLAEALASGARLEDSMIKKLVIGLLLSLVPLTAFAKKQTVPAKPAKIVMSPASTVPAGDIMKYLHKKCPNVTITLDSTKSDYMLQARGWSGNYHFTLYRNGGDLVFGTTTIMLSNAVKDVCKFINTQK